MLTRPIWTRDARVWSTLLRDNWGDQGEPPSTEFSDEEYCDVFLREPWVYACVNAIRTDVAALPTRIKSDDGTELPRPWRKPLDIFEIPNELQSFDQLVSSCLTDLLLTGEWYELYTGYELARLPSYACTPIPNKSGGLTKVRMKGSDGRVQDFAPEEIIYIANPAPLSVVNGMSSLAPLRDTLSKTAGQVKYEKSLWKNFARVPGLLKTDQRLEKDQRDKMRDEWHARTRGENVGRDQVLSHGLSYERVGLDTLESGYHESRRENRDEILSVFGVPPIRVGLQDRSPYSNSNTQMAGYWRSPITPLAKLISNAHSRVVFDKVPLWLELDAATSAFTAADKSELWNLVARACAWRPLITQNEGRALMGYPRHDDPLADQLIQPPSSLFAGTPGAAAMLDLGQLQQVTDAQSVTAEPVRALSAARCCDNRRAAVMDNATQLRVARHQSSLDREHDIAKQDLALPLLDAILAADLAAINGNLRERGLQKFTRATAPDLPKPSTFDDKAGDLVETYLRGCFKRVGQAELIALQQQKQALRALRGVRADTVVPDLDLFDEAVARIIRNRRQMITTVPATAQDAAHNVVATLAEDGASIDDMRKALVDLFDNLRDYEAERIARTESGVGSSSAADVAMEQADVDEIAWLSTPDDGRNRPEHLAMNGETIKRGDTFSNGLHYPMDPMGEAGEVINCRCAHVAVSFREEEPA